MCHRIFSVIFTIFGSFIFVESAFRTFVLHNLLRHYVTTFFEYSVVSQNLVDTFTVCWSTCRAPGRAAGARRGWRRPWRWGGWRPRTGGRTARGRRWRCCAPSSALAGTPPPASPPGYPALPSIIGVIEFRECMYCYFVEFSLKMFNLENKTFAFAQQMLYKCAVYGIASLNVNMLNKP